ncbi:MAG TPA: Ppx/GppA phosphatase family protein [Vicinamibacterales bacterium]|jgi:exopolyphosphatase/guanosine-5'-triphosphate,3'-diphosphate pyrophosphatase
MRLAAIDIGTNSIHMIVVQVRPDFSFEIVDREKEMVRLGAGGLGGRALSAGAMTAALDTLGRFKQLADSRQVDEIIAAATSAVRESKNGGEFLATVAERTGIRPRVISGIEEARLIHMAAVYGVNASSGTTVVVDIGGGSMEVTLGTAAETHLARSFSLGVIRLTDRFVTSDPLSNRDERRLIKHVRSQVEGFADQLRNAGFDRVIATSGTSLSLGEVALSRRLFDGDSIHHRRISAKELHRARKSIVALDMQHRLRLPGLDARRADLVVAGAILLDTTVRMLGAKDITLCDLALREGLILDYIGKNRKRIASIDRYPDIRRRSVIELGERCRWYPEHAEQVARLALSLFDQTRGIHQLNDRARQWLDFAALLHDIGGHIAYLGHHKHSYYLIRNGGLRGFEPDEIEAIALMARYHRRGRPRKSQSALASLAPPARRAVRVGAALLRMAECLDRSHGQVIDQVELQPAGERYRLVLRAHGPIELERWAALRQVAPLERLLGKPLLIESTSDAEHTDDPAPVPGTADRRRRNRRLG